LTGNAVDGVIYDITKFRVTEQGICTRSGFARWRLSAVTTTGTSWP
jgi:hypothetical protein